MSPKFLQPALLGGVMIGVLSALPIVNIANCCCLWIIGGGMAAAYLMQSGHPRPITAADGALVGLMAGAFGAVVWLVITVPLNMVLGPMQQRLLQRILDNAQDIPESMRVFVDNFRASGVGAIRAAIGFVTMLVIGAVFATLGGALGAVLFKKKIPPTDEPPTNMP